MKKTLVRAAGSLAALALVAGLSLGLASCASAPGAEFAEPVVPALPVGPGLLDSFEDDVQWFAVGGGWNDGDNSKDAATSEANATLGKKSLALTFDAPEGGKGTFYTENAAIQDWTGVGSVKVDVFNPASVDMGMILAVCTGDAWAWHETPEVILKPGLNKDVTFAIVGGQFKADSTGWAFTTMVPPDMNKVPRVVFRFLPKAAAGTLTAYIDNVRLLP